MHEIKTRNDGLPLIYKNEHHFRILLIIQIIV